MSNSNQDDLSQFSMLELFRVEAETQCASLTAVLLALESSPGTTSDAAQLESLMRAAHSLKGAARIVELPPAVQIAHAMEDCFVAAQRGEIKLGAAEVDVLLRCVDLFQAIARQSAAQTNPETGKQIERLLAELALLQKPISSTSPARDAGESRTRNEDEDDLGEAANKTSTQTSGALATKETESVLRLTAENMNRLLGLAGESLVESRRLQPFSDSMQRLKRLQYELSRSLELFRESLDERALPERAKAEFAELFGKVAECKEFLARQIDELDVFDRRSNRISQRLYNEVLQCRMRSFGDGVRHFPRMVRDLARELGKTVRLEIIGEKTQVDRDILEKLDSALTHLLRNAVDHGCESPKQRQQASKSPECIVHLEARHAAGMLLVTVSDDGSGIDPKRLRETVALKKLAAPQVAQRLSDEELMEFLFLPGFSVKETVTEISGRGVGLNAVQTMVRSVRGSIRVISHPGKGTRFQLHLPITLSVVRALLVEVGGEPYAVPLSQIIHALKIPPEKIETLEGRRHFNLGNQQVGLVSAHQVLDCGETHANGNPSAVIVLGDRTNRYGLIVDKFLGEREFVVQPLDPRLGKVKDVSAAATMEDGSPVLILDVDDVIHSIEKLVAGGEFVMSVAAAVSDHRALGTALKAFGATVRRKRILVVDDSLTVREMERKLLVARGFEVAMAVDGIDAWNAIRSGHFDLVLTDVDMPRMDGIELVKLIKSEPRLKLPVMIISYKDRHEDRLRGLEAGAEIYLAKGSFDDETLIQQVIALIGEPESQKLG